MLSRATSKLTKALMAAEWPIPSCPWGLVANLGITGTLHP